MTTLEDRPGTALLVVDVQDDVVGEAPRRDEVVGTTAGLVDRARSEGVPVVWVQHSGEGVPAGSEAWRIVEELQPHTDLSWRSQSAPGRTAEVASAADVSPGTGATGS